MQVLQMLNRALGSVFRRCARSEAAQDNRFVALARIPGPTARSTAQDAAKAVLLSSRARLLQERRVTQASTPERLLFIRLATGITRSNALAYLVAAFFSVGLLAFLSFIQPYALNVNAMPRRAARRRSRRPERADHAVARRLRCLSDKIGRRPVYALGLCGSVWFR
jgi:hypothetical protein